MARTNPPYYNEEEDEQTRREDELLARGMNPDLANEDNGNTILSGGLNPDKFSIGADGTILSNDDDDFASAWDNLFKAGQGAPLATPTTPAAAPLGGVNEAQQRLDDATAKSNEAYSSLQGIANDWVATLEQRREEARPRFTQEELDSRRAKSTALSTLTSALANIANGLTVGAGGLNATIPDGYQAAYEHWNDVQKRHDMRQAEFDKLTDAYYTKKYGMSKADYERREAERKEGVINLENERKRQYGLDLEDKRQAGATERKQLELAEEGRQFDEKNAAGYFKKQPKQGGGGGKRSSSGSSSSKAAGNSFSYNGTDYTIPSGANVKSAFTKIANSAISKLEQSKSDLDPDLNSKDITDIDNKIIAIRGAMNVPGSSFTNTQANAILKALTKAGYDGDDIQDILDGLTQQQTQQPRTQTRTQSNSGGNGIRGNVR